jgi:hypothetical protein
VPRLPIEAKPLFRPDVLREHLAHFELSETHKSLKPRIAHWAELLRSGQADRLGERELLPEFISDIFIALLGYQGPPGIDGQYSLSRERHVQVDGQFADAVLGWFGAGEPAYVAVLEGKGPLDPLERPFAGRRMSAVDQGYRYAINLPCDWVIITSTRQTRLYYKGTDQQTYERFDTEKLASDESLLTKFVFLLGKPRVLPAAGSCHLDELFTASLEAGKKLTKSFYRVYADLRHDAFERLSQLNPSIDRHIILSTTQKLLDRVLFCAFSEDRALLPKNTLKHAYEHNDPYNPRPIWENFRGLFSAINRGSERLKIPQYNGGLFADDSILDSLIIPDEVCAGFKLLGDYDYRPAQDLSSAPEPDADDEPAAPVIDVDILGHIFEQSISDLEKLRNELDGLVEPVSKEKHKTRRKKEGAFYTPSFVTRYIVEQTVGGVITERFEKLRQQHEADATRAMKPLFSHPGVYDLSSLRPAQRDALLQFWETWQAELGSIRIIDPACGSGAFLIEAFDQLHAAYEQANDRIADFQGQRRLFELDKHILQHNLYGVDLNEEAIEICRLSLWIKTAQRGKILTSLDHSICVGNSVVADTTVDSKALNWQSSFPEVFASGGFDVVVGNPPYIRQEWLAPYKPHWEATFASYDGSADIFAYFYELGIRLLRPGGKLGFITSGSWVRGNFALNLRQFISQNAAPQSMIDFGEYQPFEDAEMIRPTIAILQKNAEPRKMKLFKWLTAGSPPENLSEVIANATTLKTTHLSAAAWELESEEAIELRKKLADSGRPLGEYTSGQFYRGIVSGLTEVFVINERQRQDLIRQDSRSAEIIKPFVQGTHLRPWYIETSDQFLIFTRRGIEIENYPAVLAYLQSHREQLEPRPESWNIARDGLWRGRKPGSYRWYEIQDAIDYWQELERPKIMWPDISKRPRFSMDLGQRYLGNTAFAVPGEDYFLLGVLSSWATWFYISKTAQPLRLRGDRWQYRLFTQYMENIPVPEAKAAERDAIANLARQCGAAGIERYLLEENVRQRIATTFGRAEHGESRGSLNNAAQAWWVPPLGQLGNALKKSYALARNPFESPRVADEWEPYLHEKRTAQETLSRKVKETEAELNERVYRLFGLSTEEVSLLEREVEH